MRKYVARVRLQEAIAGGNRGEIITRIEALQLLSDDYTTVLTAIFKAELYTEIIRFALRELGPSMEFVEQACKALADSIRAAQYGPHALPQMLLNAEKVIHA